MFISLFSVITRTSPKASRRQTRRRNAREQTINIEQSHVLVFFSVGSSGSITAISAAARIFFSHFICLCSTSRGARQSTLSTVANRTAIEFLHKTGCGPPVQDHHPQS
ncbi:unnamed protein product [Amoebophrya sp. A25]|nr:unnamed protein product [Amoebophrya sp. A25]|eukprot:GSA25T00015874001.1